LLSVAIHRSPTTGGVFASYASLCDIRAAVDGATIGFAGPRVVESTTGLRLPADSHTARSALAAGLVDAVLSSDEDEQASWVANALGVGGGRQPAVILHVAPLPPSGPWELVQAARSSAANTGSTWARLLLTDPIWLHPAPGLVGGLAHLDGERVGVLAMDRHTGRPTPASYDLAQRVAELAGRLGLPLLTFVDTPGADPSPASEAAGIAGAIARTFACLDAVPVPSVAICVGEGGSGGALALAHCDQLLILEHAIFSVISPEGAAAILHRDASRAPELAEQLKLAPADLLALGIVDAIVPADPGAVLEALRKALATAVIGDRRRRPDAATAKWVR
jgi:acetyl-CoA carboxylase carboxyl transferase subunit beta